MNIWIVITKVENDMGNDLVITHTLDEELAHIRVNTCPGVVHTKRDDDTIRGFNCNGQIVSKAEYRNIE